MRLFLVAVSACMLAGCGSGGSDRSADAANATKAATPLPPGPKLGAIDLSKAVRAQGKGWTLDVAPGEIQFLREGRAAPTDFYPVGPVVAGDRASWATQDPAGEPVSIVLTKAPCAGEGALPLSAEVKIGAESLKGCAGARPPGTKPLDATSGNTADADLTG